MNADGLLANIADAGKVAPFQPWAKGLYEYRQTTLLKDDPMASCLPPGGPRQFQVPYGIQIVEQPEKKTDLCDVGRRQSQLAADQSRWPRASAGRRDSHLLRRFRGQVGRRHAGGRHASVSTSVSGLPTAACRTRKICI